jgi:hypothetical protein
MTERQLYYLVRVVHQQSKRIRPLIWILDSPAMNTVTFLPSSWPFHVQLYGFISHSALEFHSMSHLQGQGGHARA